MADHIWKEKGNHLLLWDKVEIIDRAEHWKIRCLKELAHMLGYNEGQRTYQPKRSGNNKDEDNSPKTLNDKNPANGVSISVKYDVGV